MHRIQEDFENIVETDLYSVENYTTLIRFTTSMFLRSEMKFDPDISPHELLYQIFDQYVPYLASKLEKIRSIVYYRDFAEFLELYKSYIMDINHLSENTVKVYTNWLLTNFGNTSLLPLEFDTLMAQLLTLDVSEKFCDLFHDLLVSVYRLNS